MTHPILLVDDDPSVIASLALLLKQAGFRTEPADDGDRAFALLDRQHFSLVILDMNFSRQITGEEGLSILTRIKTAHPHLPVILITAWGSISLAVAGIKAGAADFITKPWSNEQLLHAVKTALGLAEARMDAASDTPVSRAELDRRYDFSRIIGEDPALMRVLDIAGRVSRTGASVLITGESGTGKELVADAIHANSARADGPFVKVNLGGISSSLFESEMFGHVRGAFTDARQNREGRFERARGGTIFLDEIGDLDPDCQVKILRVLQDFTYEVVGSSETRSLDVRVISATNRDLPAMIGSGQFREDLLYRLNLITLPVPPLRERKSDIPLLVRQFARSISTVYHRSEITVSDKALNWLITLPWPGNIRQLRQLVERTILLSDAKVLSERDFIRSLALQPVDTQKAAKQASGSMTLDELERTAIVEAMVAHGNDVGDAADALGISQAALYRRLKKHGIRP